MQISTDVATRRVWLAPNVYTALHVTRIKVTMTNSNSNNEASRLTICGFHISICVTDPEYYECTISYVKTQTTIYNQFTSMLRKK